MTSPRRRLAIIAAVVGPGMLAGLSDDDPAGITTYSVLGTDHGMKLLWVLAMSTVALALFHELGARMGIVTGQGLIGLARDAYGVRRAGLTLVALVAANLGTTCAEYAGIAAGFELFGVTKYASVPLAAIIVTLLVVRGTFHVVERVLMLVSAVFVAYIAAGILAHPDWSAAGRGLVVPSMPMDRSTVVIVTATIGTTLAPWGLTFIQSYAADKRLTPKDLGPERVDVIVGSLLTGIIGFFVVVACAATLHEQGITIDNASDAANALEPLAGHLAADLFAVGLIGAALLAASILPLSTAYSVSEFSGRESALDDRFREAPLFYVTYIATTAVAALIVLAPGAPLITILVGTQVLNAVLLIPILLVMYGIGRNRHLMGEHAVGRFGSIGYVVAIAGITTCVGALAVVSVT